MARQAYPLEFRRQIVELAKAGRSFRELAEEFEPSEQTIRNWVKQAELDDGVRHDGLPSAEHDELKRLRRENRQLRLERDGVELYYMRARWYDPEIGRFISEEHAVGTPDVRNPVRDVGPVRPAV